MNVYMTIYSFAFEFACVCMHESMSRGVCVVSPIYDIYVFASVCESRSVKQYKYMYMNICTHIYVCIYVYESA